MLFCPSNTHFNALVVVLQKVRDSSDEFNHTHIVLFKHWNNAWEFIGTWGHSAGESQPGYMYTDILLEVYELCIGWEACIFLHVCMCVCPQRGI